MAIDRPRGGRPAPEGSQRSGERQASGYFGARGMTEAKPQSGENSCGPPLRRRPRSAAPAPRPDQPITGRQDGPAEDRHTQESTRRTPAPPQRTGRRALGPTPTISLRPAPCDTAGQCSPRLVPTRAMQPADMAYTGRPGTRSSRPPRPTPRPPPRPNQRRT